MGMVHTEITLINAGDITACERGILKEPEIRKTTVQAVVDTGAMTLVINEELRQLLGLGVKGERIATLANNAKQRVKVADTVEVHWKNRTMACQPWVVPESGMILLGVIPLENMDLMVDPVHLELVGAHGEEEVYML